MHDNHDAFHRLENAYLLIAAVPTWHGPLDRHITGLGALMISNLGTNIATITPIYKYEAVQS